MTDTEPHKATPPVSAAWRRLVQGFATLVAGEGAARIFGLASVYIVARALGPSGFGVIAAATAIVGWYALAVDNGTQVASTPDIARRPAEFRTIVGPVLGLRIASALVAMTVIIGGSLAFARSSLHAEVYALFSLVLLASALNMRWLALGVKGERAIATANAFGQLVVLALSFGLVNVHADITRVPIIVAIGELTFALTVAGLIARRVGIVWPRVDLVAWRDTITRGLPLLVGSASRGALLAFDLLVITIFLGPEDAGYYGAAMRPMLLAATIVGLFSLSFLASYSASGDAARALFRRALVSAVLLSVSCAAVLTVLATPLVEIVFGSSFAPAATVMVILAWRIPSMALSGIYGSSLIAAGQGRWVMRSNVAGAAFNIPTVAIVVQFFGINAAAITSVVASTGIALIIHHAAVRHGSAPRLRNLLGRPGFPRPSRSGGLSGE